MDTDLNAAGLSVSLSPVPPGPVLAAGFPALPDIPLSNFPNPGFSQDPLSVPHMLTPVDDVPDPALSADSSSVQPMICFPASLLKRTYEGWGHPFRSFPPTSS